jgi:hypothetical protein
MLNVLFKALLCGKAGILHNDANKPTSVFCLLAEGVALRKKKEKEKNSC